MLKKQAQELLAFTEGARDDFHEPDEQGIRLRAVVGDKLDNAFGEQIDAEAIAGGYQEVVVVLQRKDENVSRQLKINLATLIALARVGAKQLTRYQVNETPKRGEREGICPFCGAWPGHAPGCPNPS